MNPKKLEPESSYARYDTDGDGVVTDDELKISARLQELEMLHEKSTAQRNMVWFALFGMLSDMANMYFLATGGVVSVFFGSQVFAGKNK